MLLVSVYMLCKEPRVKEDGGSGGCGRIGDADYLHAFHHLVMPIAYEYSPDAVVISAGFDAAMGDPLGRCNVTPAGYAHMTSMLMGLAKGRVVCIYTCIIGDDAMLFFPLLLLTHSRTAGDCHSHSSRWLF